MILQDPLGIMGCHIPYLAKHLETPVEMCDAFGGIWRKVWDSLRDSRRSFFAAVSFAFWFMTCAADWIADTWRFVWFSHLFIYLLFFPPFCWQSMVSSVSTRSRRDTINPFRLFFPLYFYVLFKCFFSWLVVFSFSSSSLFCSVVFFFSLFFYPDRCTLLLRFGSIYYSTR